MENSELQPYPELLDRALLLLSGYAPEAPPRVEWSHCCWSGPRVNTLPNEPLVLTASQIHEAWPDGTTLSVVKVDHLVTVGDLADVGPAPVELQIHQADPDDAALLVLTSGSTGNAKAAMLNHANLLWFGWPGSRACR